MRRVQDEQDRNNQARQRAEQQAQVARRQADQLAEERRAAQYRAQQDYAARIEQEQRQQRQQRQQQLRIENDRYRYNIGGNYHQTNQYGADVLRQAVNNGYLQGVRAGQRDRQDRWPPNYQTSPEYRDAEYGFSGNYVDRSDYGYYFRQGFQRGYEDGYYSRSQYGSYSNGGGSVLGNILSSILGLESIR